MTWEPALIVLCTLVVVALCGVVVIAGLLMSRPVQREVGPAPPGLAGAEPVRIPSRSGTVLSGWWINGEPGGGCIVLMHGVRRNRLSMARRAELLHGWGFSVLLFDFQAHGASPGRAITFGHLEALDANAAIGFARHRVPAERLGVIGVSLGGAAALLAPEPPRVDALVLESVFPDLRTALINRLHIYLGPVWGTALAPILAPMFRLLMWAVLGVRATTLRPIDHIAGVTAPVLIASGTRDRSTTIEEARTLFHHATDPKQFWAVEGAGHVNLERHNPAAYWRVVLPFITRYVQSEAQPVTNQSVGT
jgi:pimeloyl-ACP methyl ester carboxylesterase